jgi:hypothetical protein
MLAPAGRGNRDHSVLQEPCERNDRRGYAVALSDPLQHRVLCHPPASQRHVGGNENTVSLTAGTDRAVLEIGMHLDLVYHELAGSEEGDGPLHKCTGEVGYADLPRQAAGLCLRQILQVAG